MALEIFVPDSSYADQRVSLDGSVFTFEYKFNVRNNNWYLNIYDIQKNTALIRGLAIKPNQNLTGRYLIDGLTEGSIWCIRTKGSKEPIGRDNLGIGKAYGLFYISDSSSLGSIINDFVQL